MKNIYLVVPLDFTAFLCCKYMVSELKDRYPGADITVVCDVTPGEDYASTIKAWGADVVFVSIPRHVNPIGDLKFLIRLTKILRGADLVISTCTKPNLYTPLAAKICRVGSVGIGIWGRGTSYVDNPSLKIRLLQKIQNLMYRISFSLSDWIWFTNPNDMEYFENNGWLPANKSKLTKNYVDSDLFSPAAVVDAHVEKLKSEFADGKDSKIVLLSGRMIWAKGIQDFSEAAQLLSDSHPQIHFWLLGAAEPTSPDAVPLSYIHEIEGKSNLKWLGFRSDILDLYASCDIAVLPSYYREGGYPRALTEPMSMGKPVIAANCPDCNKPVDDGVNGFLVEVGESKSLAEKIVQILENPDMAKSFGAESRKKVLREYDEKVVIKELYDAVLCK